MRRSFCGCLGGSRGHRAEANRRLGIASAHPKLVVWPEEDFSTHRIDDEVKRARLARRIAQGQTAGKPEGAEAS